MISDENEDFLFTCYFDEVSAVFFAKQNWREILAATRLKGIIFDEDTSLVWEDANYFLWR
ncbi:hypothetical protein GCM10008967_27980 [Bacillus carboniphilus]|uniref:DUF2442 domain-containing protein n=2 Tax=Bacillus carboniphilus TaxID=86663 RepID=A0ABP3G4Q9_9BACI